VASSAQASKAADIASALRSFPACHSRLARNTSAPIIAASTWGRRSVAGSTPSRSVRRHHHPGRPAVSDGGQDAAAAGQLDSRHLPALNPVQLSGVKSAVSVGLAPVPPSTPPRVASVITEISHHAFVSGMHAHSWSPPSSRWPAPRSR
jgi:hypothetical protein